MPLLAPCIMPASPLGLAGLPYPGFPKDPKLQILQVCPTAGCSRAWMEAHLLQLPQRLLLLGAAALTVSTLETGEHKGTWLGAQEMWAPPPSEIVSAVSTHSNGLGPLELGRLGNPGWAWSCPALPSVPKPLWEWSFKSPRSRGQGWVGQPSDLAVQTLPALESDSPESTHSSAASCVSTTEITVSTFCFFSSKMGIIIDTCPLREFITLHIR